MIAFMDTQLCAQGHALNLSAIRPIRGHVAVHPMHDNRRPGSKLRAAGCTFVFRPSMIHVG